MFRIPETLYLRSIRSSLTVMQSLRPDGGYPNVQTRDAVAGRGLEYRAIDRRERDMKPPILVDFPETLRDGAAL